MFVPPTSMPSTQRWRLRARVVRRAATLMAGIRRDAEQGCCGPGERQDFVLPGMGDENRIARAEHECRTLGFPVRAHHQLAGEADEHRVAAMRGLLAGGASRYLQFGDRQVLGADDQADGDRTLQPQRTLARPDSVQGRKRSRTDAIAQQLVASIDRRLQVFLFHRIGAARTLRRRRREEFEHAQRFRALRAYVMPGVLAEEKRFAGQALDGLAGLRIAGEHRSLQHVEHLVRGKHGSEGRRMPEPAPGRHAELDDVDLVGRGVQPVAHQAGLLVTPDVMLDFAATGERGCVVGRARGGGVSR